MSAVAASMSVGFRFSVRGLLSLSLVLVYVS